MKFKVGQKVKIKESLWNEKTPLPTGTIVGTFPLDTRLFDTESKLLVSVRHSQYTPYGYDVVWDHTEKSNPWSEIELEAA